MGKCHIQKVGWEFYCSQLLVLLLSDLRAGRRVWVCLLADSLPCLVIHQPNHTGDLAYISLALFCELLPQLPG